MALAQKSKAPSKATAAQPVKATGKVARTGASKGIPPKKSLSKTETVAKAKAALKKVTPESAVLAVPKAPVTAKAAAPAAVPAKKTKSRKISIAATAGESATALTQKWAQLFKKADQIEAKPYNMRILFEEKTAIMHKLLGWGYILANRNDRLEVLFKDGIKYLISNYKP